MSIIIAIVAAALVLGAINAFAVWMTYGFTPIDWICGGIRASESGFPYVLRRFWFSPQGVFWFAGEREEQFRVARLVLKGVPFSYPELSMEDESAACTAKRRGLSVWPSKEIAEAVGDPGGWYPGAKP